MSPNNHRRSAWEQATVVRWESRWLAAFLNLIPGLGHIYLGNWKRGVATFSISVLFGMCFFVTFPFAALAGGPAFLSQYFSECGTPLALGLAFALVWDGYRAATQVGGTPSASTASKRLLVFGVLAVGVTLLLALGPMVLMLISLR